MQGSLPSSPELFCNEGANVIKLLTTQEIIPIVWLARATKKVGKQKKKKKKKESRFAVRWNGRNWLEEQDWFFRRLNYFSIKLRNFDHVGSHGNSLYGSPTYIYVSKNQLP